MDVVVGISIMYYYILLILLHERIVHTLKFE